MNAPTLIAIEAGDRWDALALTRRLPHGCRWYLVQREGARWDVHVEPQADGPEQAAREILDATSTWVSERKADAVVRIAACGASALAAR